MEKKKQQSNYDKLLQRAKSLIPDEISSTERLEVPNVKGHIQGNKTIITNFFQICKVLDRPSENVLKFLLKELATKGTVRGTRVLFNNRIHSKKINEKIKKYSDIFVICKECKKPETKLVQENNLLFLKCQACGAQYTIQYKL
jgi:translation initiation factor 2 subunit 2